MKKSINNIDLESLGLNESNLTGKVLHIGDQVLAEVDVRHFSPPGWSTYKFMDPTKAAEFAAEWSAKGGAVLASRDVVDNELVGSRNLYYIYAGPIQNFYGESCCLTLGLSKKPDKIEKTKSDKTRLASHGSFSDFYEALGKGRIIIKLSGKEAFVLRAVLLDAHQNNELKKLKGKFRNEIDGWTINPETLDLTSAEYDELYSVLESYLNDRGFMDTFFKLPGMESAFIDVLKKCGLEKVVKEAKEEKPRTLPKQQWMAEVQRLMKAWYLLDPKDYEAKYDKEMNPEEYVRWYADKYELDDYGSPESKRLVGNRG